MLRRLLNTKHLVPAAVFFLFVGYNLTVVGPAYLSDEAAYLSKAATVAGSTVHHSTSWFGGYSVLISPAYLLSSNIFVQWHIVMIINALMWVVTTYLLRYVLQQTHPKAKRLHIELATLGAILYPAWLSMSGYAFSTSGFVLVLLAVFSALAKSRLKSLPWLCLAGLAAGYLYWIHPFAILFVGLFVVLLLALAWSQKRKELLVVPLISAGMAVLYTIAVQPWFVERMKSSLGSDDHYSRGVHYVISAFSSPSVWGSIALELLGLLFTLIIATFGFAVFAAVPVWQRLVKDRRKCRTLLQDTSFVLQLLAVLSVVLILGFVAVLWGTNGHRRIDHWIYERYTDMYILPLLAMGLLARWRLKWSAFLAGLVLAIGIVLSLVTNPANTSFRFVNKVDLQALWSMHAASAVTSTIANYWLWGLIGAIGVLFVGFATGKRKRLLWLLALPIALSAAGNYRYHHAIIRDHSMVTSLYDQLKNTYSRSDCIGFTPQKNSSERFQLYAYYLHGYNLRQMTLQQWQQSCAGPYLTYRLPPQSSFSYDIVGREEISGLYLITKALPRHNTAVPLLFK